MNHQELNIHFAGEELTLHHQRALYWRREKTLLLADLHLGKAAHFRKNGIALPTQVNLKDLERLENLLLHYHPQRVIIVGDLIHAGANKEVDEFSTFINRFSDIELILIKGNHDRFSTKKLKEMGIISVHSDLQIETITLSHQNIENLSSPSIVGHTHPGVRIKMPTKGYLKFPCFVVTDNQIILPAFSQFTGLDTDNIPTDATCYVVYDEGILKLA